MDQPPFWSTLLISEDRYSLAELIDEDEFEYYVHKVPNSLKIQRHLSRLPTYFTQICTT